LIVNNHNAGVFNENVGLRSIILLFPTYFVENMVSVHYWHCMFVMLLFNKRAWPLIKSYSWKLY